MKNNLTQAQLGQILDHKIQRDQKKNKTPTAIFE